MGTVRTAALPARPVELVNVSVTTPQQGTLLKLLSDRKTLVFWQANNYGISTDYGVTVNLKHGFNDATWRIGAFQETPGGEVLVGVQGTTTSTVAGELWRSTGWNVTTGTATSWTRVLVGSGLGVYFNGAWGLGNYSVAPSWSKHAGAIFVAEYGTHAGEAATPEQGAVHVLMSTDDGVTWRTVFDLTAQWPTETNLHVHGVAYDPWAGRVVISQGDGGGTGSLVAHCGIWYSDNVEAITPTWTLLPGSSTVTAYEQSTTVMALESGILALQDGRPTGIRFIPRRGLNQYGPIREVVVVSGYSDPFIGQGVWRNGGLETPIPGAPILAVFSEPSTGTGQPALFVSPDGSNFRVLYRHGTAVSNTAPGFRRVFGPDINGKIVAELDLSGTSQVFTADYQPVLDPFTTAGSGGTGSAGIASADVQVFTSTGTWTKPAGAKAVEVVLMSGGGGGGSGRRGAAGTVRCGGGGGAGGATSTALLRASDLPATVAITVGGGGTGGAAVTANDTNGANGTAGTASAFGGYTRANGGGLAGTGGTATAGAGGAQSTNAGGIGPSMAGGTASATGGVGGAGNGQGAAVAGNQYAGTGGGAGGGITSADVAAGGGAGGVNTYTNNLTAPGGSVDSTAPTTTNALMPGPGSGGGGGAASITTAAQAGAVGGTYGAGGGGGGASLNGSNSGAGGNGSPGVVVVTTYF